MHDPLVLVATVWRPIPKIERSRSGRWEWFPHSHFWDLGPIRCYFPSIVDVWHREADDADSGTVCGRYPRGWRRWPWMWQHRDHLQVRLPMYLHLKRYLFQRCELCGGKSRRYHPVNCSRSWSNGERQRWGQSKPGLYHSACSSVVSYRNAQDEADEALSLLGASSDLLHQLGMNPTKAWRVVYGVETRAKTFERITEGARP